MRPQGISRSNHTRTWRRTPTVFTAVTNARLLRCTGCPSPRPPSRRRPRRFSNRALVTSGIVQNATHERGASVGSLSSSLRLRGFTHLVSPASPSASRRQTPDRGFAAKSDSASKKGPRKSDGKSSTAWAKGDRRNHAHLLAGRKSPLFVSMGRS